MYPQSIKQLIDAFRRLPSVGERTAERFVFSLLKSGKKEVGELTVALKRLTDSIQSCDTCWDFSDTNPCRICADPKRDATTICVVEEPQDMQAIERTGEYAGTYHILRGLIRPDREDSVRYTKVRELFERLAKGGVTEIIIALNPDLPGETTAMYIQQKIKEAHTDLSLTRLARGLPMGSDLQYADEITLGSALKNRTKT